MRKAADVFRYCEMTPEIERMVRTKMDPLADLVPAWCDHVNVWFDESNEPDNERSNAECTIHYAYRWARIMIFPPWLTEPAHVQTDTLCHELTHIVIGPLSDWSREMLGRLVPENEAEKFHGVLQTELFERVESVVQDLTFQRLGRINTKPSALSASRLKAHRKAKGR